MQAYASHSLLDQAAVDFAFTVLAPHAESPSPWRVCSYSIDRACVCRHAPTSSDPQASALCTSSCMHNKVLPEFRAVIPSQQLLEPAADMPMAMAAIMETCLQGAALHRADDATLYCVQIQGFLNSHEPCLPCHATLPC